MREDRSQRVSELIDQSTCSWNTQVLNGCFIPMDRELTMNIPLSTHNKDDFWAWHYERTGVFSVLSAYCMLVVNRERRIVWMQPEASISDS